MSIINHSSHKRKNSEIKYNNSQTSARLQKYEVNKGIGTDTRADRVKPPADNLKKTQKKQFYQFSFISKEGTEYKLWNNNSKKSFFECLSSKVDNQEPVIQNARTISLKVLNCDENGIQLLKKIFETISRLQNTFINLKKLKLTGFSNLTGFIIPSSIEHFICNSCSNNVNICNFNNLKSITLASIPKNGNFKIDGLPNLKFITIKKLDHFSHINIIKLPKLMSIKVNGQEVPFMPITDKLQATIVYMGPSFDITKNEILDTPIIRTLPQRNDHKIHYSLF